MEKVKMPKEKIIEIAEMTVQFALEKTQEHRRQCGLDPVWYPSEERIKEWFNLAFEYLGYFVEEEA